MVPCSSKFSFGDKVIVLTFSLVVAGTLLHMSLHAVKIAERRKVSSISAEYSQLKSMFAEQQGRVSSIH